jgi:hypothetical protein
VKVTKRQFHGLLVFSDQPCHIFDWQPIGQIPYFPGKARCIAKIAVPHRSSQVKLLITNNAFCIVQRATAQSKTRIFRDCGVAEAPPGFQAGWSDCMHFFSLFLFILFAHL